MLLLNQSFLANGQDTLSLFYPSNGYLLSKVNSSYIDSVIYGEKVLQVKIEGRCDSVGSDEYNDELGRKRAFEVQMYLQEKGISPAVIAMVSSANKPTDEIDLAKNRRVDIVFFIKDRKRNWSPTKPATKETPSLASAKAGEFIQLENINFLPSRHQVLPESAAALENLRQALLANPTLTIEIRGHICCELSGDGYDAETKTQDLSVRRARAIYDYLVSKGVPSARLSYKGCGMDFPLTKEITEADRIKNRRVEVLIKSR